MCFSSSLTYLRPRFDSTNAKIITHHSTNVRSTGAATAGLAASEERGEVTRSEEEGEGRFSDGRLKDERFYYNERSHHHEQFHHNERFHHNEQLHAGRRFMSELHV